MSISTPTADYGPLYNALRMKQNALEAEYLPQQIELQQKGFELQRKSYNWSKAEAFISLGSQLGVKALGIWEDAKLEEAKGYIQQDASAMEQVIRDMVLNGKYEYAENEDGTKTISLTDEGALKKIYEDRMAAIEEKFKGFGTVQRWAKAASQKMFDEAKSNALNAFQEKAIEERSGNFVQNLEKAVQQAIEAGYEGEDKYATVDALLAGTEWLSPEAKAVARAEAVVKIDAGVDQKRYERTEKILRDVVGKEGVDRALGLVDQGAIKPEWKDKLRAAIRDQAGLSAAAYQEAAAMLVDSPEAKKARPTMADRIDAALGSVVPTYRSDVEKYLRARQEQAEHDATMKSYVRVMDNLPELEKLFETTQAEGATRYRDIADQHEKDLATISQRIKALTPSGDADGVTREAALIRTDFLNKVLVVRNDYEKRLAAGTAGSRTDAARTLMDLTLQANEAGKKIGRSIDITEAVGSALNAIYADADKVTKEGLETILTMNKTLALTNLGLDLAKLDEKNATQMGNYAIYQRRLSELNMAAIDIFSEEGITEADVKTRLNDIAARMWGEKDKYLKQTIQDTIRDSAGADRIAALQDAVSGGTLDDVVNRLDPSGEIAIFSDIKTNLGVLRARQSQTIASVLKLTPEEVLQAGRWVTTKNGDIGADQHYFIGGREYRTIGNPKAATGLTVQFLIRDKTKGDTWANLVQGQTPEIVEQMHVLGGPGAVLRGAPAAKQGTIERLNEEQAKRLAPDDTLNAFEKIAKEQAEKQQKAQAKDAADLERQKALERLNASGGMRVK